jgi:putative ABC transport system permease protein
MVTADRRRLAVSLTGVGAAIGLVLLVQGLWSGQLVQLTAYEDHVGADLFVAQRGTESMLGDASVVPLAAAAEIGEISGVSSADPVHIHYTVLDLHGAKEFVLLVGSTPDGLGGPWELAAGRQARSGDEVVLDRTLARQHGLATGDRVTMLGRDLVVVGLSEGTRSWMTSLVFITADTAADLTGGGEVASFILVQTDRPATVAAAIGESGSVDALFPDSPHRPHRGLPTLISPLTA